MRILIVLCLFLSACSFHSDLDDFPIKPTTFKSKQPEIWKLSNGLTVYYLEDSTIPIVKANLYFPGGSYYEEPATLAALEATGSLMRQGGAGDLSADDLDLELEKLSASVSASMGTENGSIGFSCLSSDLNKVFKIFSDVVLHPRYELKRLSLWKGQALESVKRRKDDPTTIASISANQLLFEPSVYGSVYSDHDVINVTRLDLLRLHRKYVRPNDAILVVSGAIKRTELDKLLDQYLKSWEASSTKLSEIKAPKFTGKKGIYFVEGPFQQSTVLMVLPGIPRRSPDEFLIKGFNTIFSQDGFSSRLIQKLRVELGLVYGGMGSMLMGPKHGKNVVYLQTKAPSAADSILASVGVLKELQVNEISDQEHKDMISSAENSFVFLYQSPESTLSRLVGLKLQGYPDNYDEQYLDNIRATSKQDIKEIANKYWDLSDFLIIVVGKNDALKSFDKLKEDPIFKNYTVKQLKFDQKLIGE